MNIVSHKRILEFYEKHNDAKVPLENWYQTAKKAKWKCFADIKKDFVSADSVGSQRYIFNIKGNDYRLAVVIQFVHGYIFVRFVGTHTAYDKIDCKTI